QKHKLFGVAADVNDIAPDQSLFWVGKTLPKRRRRDDRWAFRGKTLLFPNFIPLCNVLGKLELGVGNQPLLEAGNSVIAVFCDEVSIGIGNPLGHVIPTDRTVRLKNEKIALLPATSGVCHI